MRVVREVKIRGDLGRGSVGSADTPASLGSMVIVGTQCLSEAMRDHLCWECC
jgi:hypothetical protein